MEKRHHKIYMDKSKIPTYMIDGKERSFEVATPFTSKEAFDKHIDDFGTHKFIETYQAENGNWVIISIDEPSSRFSGDWRW